MVRPSLFQREKVKTMAFPIKLLAGLALAAGFGLLLFSQKEFFKADILGDTLKFEKKIFEFRWGDRADADYRQIKHAAIVNGELIMIGGGAGGYRDKVGEGVWSVRLSDGVVSVRELSLDGGSKYICPLHHGLIYSAFSWSEKGVVVSAANNGNIFPCGKNFSTGDQGPRGFISYTAPLQKKGGIFTFDDSPLEIDHGSEFAIAGNHVLIHAIVKNMKKSKLYTFPELTFVADTAEIVPIGAVGNFIIGYDENDLSSIRSTAEGSFPYAAYQVNGSALQKVADLPGITLSKQNYKVADRPIQLVRDSVDPNHAVIQMTRGKLFSLKATSTGVQVTESMGPTQTVNSASQGVVTSLGAVLMGVGGEYLVFTPWGDYETFILQKGSTELARAKLPKSRPLWQSTEPSFSNPPRAALFSNGKLIMVGAHGAYVYQIVKGISEPEDNQNNGNNGNNGGNGNQNPPGNQCEAAGGKGCTTNVDAGEIQFGAKGANNCTNTYCVGCSAGYTWNGSNCQANGPACNSPEIGGNGCTFSIQTGETGIGGTGAHGCTGAKPYCVKCTSGFVWSGNNCTPTP